MSQCALLCLVHRFFGGFGGGFGGFGGQQEEEQTPKGKSITVDFEVTLKDIYLGRIFQARPLATSTPRSSGAALPTFIRLAAYHPARLRGTSRRARC